jgi:hypothetical protein
MSWLLLLMEPSRAMIFGERIGAALVFCALRERIGAALVFCALEEF